MILPLAFQLMILLSSLTLVKPDCPTRCGNVDIPYPFGIFGDGGDCYLDDWFAVDCNSDKPFLRNIKHGNNSLGLEVLNISVKYSTVLVNHPAYNTCQDPTQIYKESESANLKSGPFFFSLTENVLTGLGCDNFARIRYNGSTVAGCYSCSDKDSESETKETTGCFGIACCQTRIPSSTSQVFNTSVGPVKGGSQNECKRAFLVQQNWLTENVGRPEFTNGKFISVPVVLDWWIQDYSSCEVFADSSRTGQNSSSLLQCKCSSGYEGNPYLPFGCQDVDECNDEKNNICGPNMNCRNLIGSFECYSRPKNIIMMISGIAIGLFCLLLSIGAWRGHIIIKKRKDVKLKEKYFKRNGGLLLQQQLTSFDGNVDRSKLFNSKELDKATDHFNVNRILG